MCCEQDWYNKCTKDNHCCSGFCDRFKTWKFGVCKPTKLPKQDKFGKLENSKQQCEPDFHNKCVKDEECCSKFCWKEDPEWQYGVCKEKSLLYYLRPSKN